MADKNFPFLEATLVAENSWQKNPGDFFINSGGEAYTVLEDGTLQLLRDKTYFDILYMLENNKPVSLAEYNNLDKNRMINLYLKGDVLPENVVTESVHSIVVDTTSNGFKRTSSFKIGEDITVKDKRDNTYHNLNSMLHTMMTLDLELDDYFDKVSSSKRLKVSSTGIAVDTITLKFRKCSDMLSENTNDYVNMLFTGAAARSLMSLFENIVINTARYESVTMDRNYLDSNGDLINRKFVLSSKDASGNLKFLQTVDSHIKGSMIDKEILLSHREQDKIEFDVKNEPGEIKVIKSIVCNEKGHMVGFTLRNLQHDADIYRLFYSKDMADIFFINKSSIDNVIAGSIDIAKDVTVAELTDTNVDGILEVQGITTKVYTENTEYKTAILEAKYKDVNDNKFGLNIHTYNNVEDWKSNLVTRADFESYGCVLDLEENNETVKLDISIPKDTIKSYVPDYYYNDKSLSDVYYVSDIYANFDGIARNMILAHAGHNPVNMYTIADSRVILNTVFSSLRNISYDDISLWVRLEYKKKSENYESYESYVRVTPNTNFAINIQSIINYIDIDSIRLHLHIRLNKNAVENVTSLEGAVFSLETLTVYAGNAQSQPLDREHSKKYTPIYKTGTPDIFPGNVKLSHKDGLQQSMISYDFDAGVYNDINIRIGPNTSKELVKDTKTFRYSTIHLDFGYSYLSKIDTKNKILNTTGLLEIDYPSGVSLEEMESRRNTGKAPSLTNYKIFVDLYMLPYSSTVTIVGEDQPYTNSFNEIKYTTIPSDFVPYSRDHKDIIVIKDIEVPISSLTSTGSINNKVYVDMTVLMDILGKPVEYFKDKFIDDKVYIDMDVNVGRLDTDSVIYEDAVCLSTFTINFTDVLAEYRSTLNDIVVEPTMYTNLYDKFKNIVFKTADNSVNESIFSLSSGITNLSYDNISGIITANLNKQRGVTYASLGIRNALPDKDKKGFFIKQTFTKEKHNLLKGIINIKDILNVKNTLNYDYKNLCNVHITVSGIDETGKFRIKQYIDPYLNDDNVYPDHNNISSITIDSAPYTLLEAQDFSRFVLQSNQYNDVYDVNVPINNKSNIFYFDISSIKPGTEVIIEMFIDIVYPKDDAYPNLTIQFSEFKFIAVTDEVYYSTEPHEGYYKTFGAIYRKDRDLISLEEVSLADTDDDNTNLIKVIANKFLGFATRANKLATPLKLLFSHDIKTDNGEVIPVYGLKGEAYISGDEGYTKLIDLSHIKADMKKEGFIGTLQNYELVEHEKFLPENTSYSAGAVYDEVNKLHIMNRVSSDAIVYLNDDGTDYKDPMTVPESYFKTLTTTSVVYDYYKEVKKLMAKVNEYATQQNDLMWAKSFKEVDVSLFHKEWFVYDNLVVWHINHAEWTSGSKTLGTKKKYTRDTYAYFRYTSAINGLINRKTEPGLGNISVLHKSVSTPETLAPEVVAINGLADFSATISLENGTDDWLQQSQEVTFFMTHYDRSKLKPEELDITTEPALYYKGYIEGGVTTAKIIIQQKDLLAVGNRNKDWWNHDYSGVNNMKKRAYGMRYKAYQNDVLIWDSGIIEHDYWETRDASKFVIEVTPNIGSSKKIKGRQPFKITKTSYTKRNNLSNVVHSPATAYGAWGKAHDDLFVTQTKEKVGWLNKALAAVGGLVGLIVGIGLTAAFAAVGFSLGGPTGAWLAGSAIAGMFLEMQKNPGSGFEMPVDYGKDSLLVYNKPLKPIHLFDYVSVKYNEYYTFPWLTPEAQSITHNMCTQSFKVYQSLKFTGFYKKINQIGDLFVMEELIVSHPNLDYGYCYMSDISHLALEDIPADAIKTIEAYDSSFVTSNTASTHRVKLQYVNLAKLGRVSLGTYVSEFYDDMYRIDNKTKNRLYPEVAYIEEINNTFLFKTMPVHVIPNIQLYTEISDHAPTTIVKSGLRINTDINDHNYLAYTKNVTIGDNGSIYTQTSAQISLIYKDKYVASQNTTYDFDRYKCLIKFVTLDDTCVLRDIRAIDIKTIDTTPIEVPHLNVNISFKQKLSEEVEE